jgi:hypothetical protein
MKKALAAGTAVAGMLLAPHALASRIANCGNEGLYVRNIRASGVRCSEARSVARHGGYLDGFHCTMTQGRPFPNPQPLYYQCYRGSARVWFTGENYG